jgi:plastocyanin
MGRWALVGAAAASAALLAGFATSGAVAGDNASGITIKVTDKGMTYVINKSVTDEMYFSPQIATVKSGDTLTFEYDGVPGQEPHTISIVAPKDLPKTSAQMDNCGICNRIAGGHIKNPNAPPGPTNDIVHWIVDKGRPGLSGPGDSIAIEGGKHKTVSIKVTAPAGTTLHFIGAVHPWMQGEIKVT